MKILIIDDDAGIRKTTEVALQGMGYATASVADREGALLELDRRGADVALLDLKLRGESGLDLLPELLRRWPHLSVVVFTAYASFSTAVEAVKRGAIDYIPKPFTPDQIRQVMAKVAKARRLEERVVDLEAQLSSACPTADMETEEPEMARVYGILFKAAATPATLLLLGESGTGKTVAARAVHERSLVREEPFVTVSCPSLTRELLESELFGHIKGAYTGAIRDTWGKVALAEGGTLFLDEIGEVPLEIQPKLLRLLQEREYERVGENKVRRAQVRVLAATNRSLKELVRQGKFREDLYYRLNVISVTLPPLRDRPADLMRLAEGYLRFYARQCGKAVTAFTRSAEEVMRRYSWPGNLRELQNAVERAVILADGPELDVHDLPEAVSRVEGNGTWGHEEVQVGDMLSLEALEAEHIRRVIKRSRSLDQAAQVLGIDPATLYRKRKRLDQPGNG